MKQCQSSGFDITWTQIPADCIHAIAVTYSVLPTGDDDDKVGVVMWQGPTP